jgi:hypothetical protein
MLYKLYLQVVKCLTNKAVTILNSMRLAALESEFENPISMDKFNQLPLPASENDGEVFRCMMGNYKVKVNVFAEV